MRVFILDKEKITKFNLPNKVSGVYAIDYLPVGSKIKRTVSIEARDEKWIVKSNGSVNIVSGNMIQEVAVLEEYQYQPIQIKGRNDYIGIYCIPSVEEKSTRYLVQNGAITVGSANDTSISYVNNHVLPHHISINPAQDGSFYITATDDDSHFVYLNDKRVKQTKIKVGDVIFLYGLKIIWMGTFLQINQPKDKLFINNFNLVTYNEQTTQDNTQVDPVSDEEMAIELYTDKDYFFHTPRLKQSLVEEEVNIDAPPEKQEQEEMPFLLTLGSMITMLSSSVMNAYTTIYGIASGQRGLKDSIPGLVMCISMLIGGALMPRITASYQKNKSKQKEKKRQTKYTEYIKEKEEEINVKIVNQTQILKGNNISISECYSLVFGKTRTNLWNKEIRDDDFLTVKVGTGNCPAKLKITAPQKRFTLDEDNLMDLATNISATKYTLNDVPITFSFSDKNISAFICNSSYNQDFLNGIFLQLMAYHSSQDLKLIFMLTDKDQTDFTYAKFAPHCISEDKNTRFYANNMKDIKKVSTYLEGIFQKRQREFYGKQDKDEKTQEAVDRQVEKNFGFRNFDSYYLIITNDYTAIKDVPIINEIINSKSNLGFSLNIIDDSLQSLPNECSAFIEVLDKESCIIEKELNNQQRFLPEIVTGLNMRAVANRLANIPISYVDEESALPTSMTFLEMYNVARIEQLNIRNRWKTNNPIQSLQVPIGVHKSGEQFYLDLHEKYHGPHGLIAGSTGSGKSEFIVTCLLSMAVNFHPDEVQFVLIDYKGGGLAMAFDNHETKTRIPHVVGTITNLDTAEMNRTLVSINSELKRRQRMFNDAKSVTGESTIDIYKYQKYYREGILETPISHLLIVSDEFAELKSQQPEFMDELISTARIGRSLGVHLILATQKPSGVVNDQIWSNTKFRVCLKVADRGDSMEVLKKPDAASIKETGRFYLQVGFDEYFDIGQSGWAGAKYIPSDAVIKKIDDSIKFVDNVGNVTKTINEIVKRVEVAEKGDQLSNIVKHITEIAAEDNYVAQKLWLDKIPAEIFLGNLKKKYNYQPEPYVINPIIGEYDQPAAQKQGLLTLNLSSANTLIWGMNDSGKEDLLATMIYSAIADHSPDELHMYILDFGSETLKVFSKAPQIGEVCTVDSQEQIVNLFIMIDKELDRRKDLFVDYGGSYKNYIEQSGEKLPLISIIINNYEIFSETMGNFTEMISTMYRDALKCGVSFVITTGAANSFRPRLAEYFSNKLCLQMANDTDYRTLLMCAKGLIPYKVRGRGITGIGDMKLEFQTAYITKPDKVTQTIREGVLVLQKNYTTHATRVPVLPDVVTVDHLLEDIKDLTKVPIGVNVESKYNETYDFTKDQINVVLANNISEHENFFFSLFKILKRIPQTKVRVLDVAKTYDNAKIPVECYTDKFDAILPALIQEIEKTTTDIKRVYVINGVSKLKSKINENTYPIYEKFFRAIKESENTIAIIADNESDYQRLELETWYDEVINKHRGIWLGEDVGNQLAIRVDNIDPEIRNQSFPDMAFILDETTVIPIKKVVSDKEENQDEK
ncbi:MAG: type VII secretion protein EssC [Bacilli bacterium]|nr:type VII secretion protein EssC [Bacilli bacterium]